MSPRLRSFLQGWAVTTVGVLVAANVVTGIRYENAGGLILASLILGILNALVRPILIFVALPLVIVTLGLFMLVINALLLYAVGALVRTFHVETFGAAFWGALIISLTSLFTNWLIGPNEVKVQVSRRRPPPPPPRPGDGGGPVIDV